MTAQTSRRTTVWIAIIGMFAVYAAMTPAYGHNCSPWQDAPHTIMGGDLIEARAGIVCNADSGNDKQQTRLYRVQTWGPDDRWGSAFDNSPGYNGFGNFEAWGWWCEDENQYNVMQTWSLFSVSSDSHNSWGSYEKNSGSLLCEGI